MRTAHFYKLYSRLGLKNPPIGSTEHNYGVEKGPDAVLTPKFLATFPDASVTSYDFPIPEQVSTVDYHQALARHIGACSMLIKQTLKDNEAQVAVGGDHSVAAATLLAVLEKRNPKSVGYIQFDSHGDIHQFATSPTGNFHGMWLRPFLETMDDPDVSQAIAARLPLSHICYIGNLNLEIEEVQFMKKHHILHVSEHAIETHKKQTLDRFAAYINQFPHMHISFDIDVFAHELAPATGTPNISGLYMEDVFPFLDILATHPSISVDLVEVNPQKVGAIRTITLAQDVLQKLLSG